MPKCTQTKDTRAQILERAWSLHSWKHHIRENCSILGNKTRTKCGICKEELENIPSSGWHSYPDPVSPWATILSNWTRASHRESWKTNKLRSGNQQHLKKINNKKTVSFRHCTSARSTIFWNSHHLMTLGTAICHSKINIFPDHSKPNMVTSSTIVRDQNSYSSSVLTFKYSSSITVMQFPHIVFQQSKCTAISGDSHPNSKWFTESMTELQVVHCCRNCKSLVPSPVCIAHMA